MLVSVRVTAFLGWINITSYQEVGINSKMSSKKSLPSSNEINCLLSLYGSLLVPPRPNEKWEPMVHVSNRKWPVNPPLKKMDSDSVVVLEGNWWDLGVCNFWDAPIWKKYSFECSSCNLASPLQVSPLFSPMSTCPKQAKAANPSRTGSMKCGWMVTCTPSYICLIGIMISIMSVFYNPYNYNSHKQPDVFILMGGSKEPTHLLGNERKPADFRGSEDSDGVYRVEKKTQTNMTSWKITIFNRRYIFKSLFFHCHVSLSGCKDCNVKKKTLDRKNPLSRNPV